MTKLTSRIASHRTGTPSGQFQDADFFSKLDCCLLRVSFLSSCCSFVSQIFVVRCRRRRHNSPKYSQLLEVSPRAPSSPLVLPFDVTVVRLPVLLSAFLLLNVQMWKFLFAHLDTLTRSFRMFSPLMQGGVPQVFRSVARWVPAIFGVPHETGSEPQEIILRRRVLG